MKSPQELIDHVATIVQQKFEKKMKCFYTVKVFKNDATNELITRKAASPEFLADLQQIISVNKPETVIVELYKGSSYKVKTPESEFYITLQGREVSFPARVESVSGFDNTMMFSEMRRSFDQQMQGVRELTGLHSSLTVSQLELKYAQEKIKELQQELKDSEEYIEQLEKGARSRPQLGGVGGINLVELGSHMLEGVLRRNPGLLAGIAGVDADKVKDLFSEPKALPPAQQQTGSATATVTPQSEQLTEREKVRAQIVEEIAGYLRQLPDAHLRIVYEFACALGKDEALFAQLKDLIPPQENSQSNNQ